MRKVALLLVLVMMVSCVSAFGLAEDPVIKESASGFYYIEAEGNRPRLSAASADKFFQVDGEWFKDMNGNGELDVYEDWRLDKETRAWDVVGKMSLEEKAGTLVFSGIGGKNGSVATDFSGDGTGGGNRDYNNEELYTSHEVMYTLDGVNYCPMPFQIQDMHVTTYIAALTGMPKDQLDVLNRIQTIAEDTALGIPVTFSGDRSYNTWGGMIDMPHYAFGVAHDPELLYNLVSEYAKEGAAIGYQQVFHGYGNEIGSFYGDDPNYIAEMSAIETKAYNDYNFQAHSKHFIARGGRSNYAGAKSPADLLDSWLVGWKAVVDAGTEWVMTNNNQGVTGGGLQTYMDSATYALLRDHLGYDGVICLDWPLDMASLMQQTGITPDGTDVSTLSAVERYALILNTGVDMFSALGVVPGTDIEAYSDSGFRRAFPDLIAQTVTDKLVSEEDFNYHVFRVIRNKMGQGLFENPYHDWEEALALISNGHYTTDSPIPLNNDEIDQYRRPEIKEMEEKLMVKSTIMFKNDGILPLKAEAKVYLDSNCNSKDNLTAAIESKATVVEELTEANVAVFHVSSFNDAYELMIEDAQAANVPVIIIFEGTVSSEPALRQFIEANALLMQTYNNTPDHGSSTGSFYRYVKPSITVEMLFGEKEPAGKSLYELGYEASAKALSWGELQDDIGVSDEVRLYMAMLAKENPNIDMPNNLGDVIVTDGFGIEYSKPADIQLSLLTLPRMVEEKEVEGSSGGTQLQTTVSNIIPKAGEPFKISFVAKNNGEGDGLITVPVLANGEVVAEKIVGLTAGQFRVITVYVTLEAGEYTLTVGDMSSNIVVE